jgi:DNA invertase Pin-like site-specific DNA recombinase
LTPQIPGKTQRLVGYSRVSTEDQEEFGVSLDLQKAQIEAFAAGAGRELVAFCTDALSAKTLERPGLRRALGMLIAGEADAIVVTKLDRLTRCVRDGEELLDGYFRGHERLKSLGDPVDTKSADGIWVFRLFISLGARERERTAERTTEGLARLRATGGGTPQVGAATAARIHALKAEGFSLRAICTQLIFEGHPTTKGGMWQPETVRKVLARAR